MSAPRQAADVVVIGAGIAGLTVGAELARDRSVVVLEADTGPGQQTTGRSAATYFESYGGPAVQPFNRAARGWLESGGDGHVDHSLLAPRGLVLIRAPGGPSWDDGPPEGSTPISVEEAVDRFPLVRPEACAAAAWNPDVLDLDAAGAVAAARAALRARGGELAVSSRVTALERRAGTWLIETQGAAYTAAVVVDAAGAWSDEVAVLAGLPPIGLRPLRRTICTFRAEPGLGHEPWPMLLDDGERFYLKPEPGQFLASPADETPSAPGDPQADMVDVATALERVAEATTLRPRSILRAWAGLRTFAPDRSLVLGPDPLEPAFVWCAGQGGFGLQSSPAAARAVVTLVDRGALPDDILAAGGDRAAVTPDRFRAGGAGTSSA